MRVTRRGLAMPQLRGGNGRSQEYLAFLLPLLHNGGRTPRPQTRSEQFTFTVNDNLNLKYFKYYCCCCLRWRKQFSRRLFSSELCVPQSRPSVPSPAFRVENINIENLAPASRNWRQREREIFYPRLKKYIGGPRNWGNILVLLSLLWINTDNMTDPTKKQVLLEVM